jgi:hypothetical protein
MINKEITILSLGAGVQSSCLALMALRGEIEQPDCAIFADTGNEPAGVYEYLDYLRGMIPFPIITASCGNLGEDFIAALRGDKKRYGQPPFYVTNGNDDNGGMLWRQCTKEYKIDVVRRAARAEMVKAGAKQVCQWIGISTDEMQRLKDSGVKYIRNEWPLIEMKMSRTDCLRWLKDNGFRLPGKSACVFCPYRSNQGWREMRDKDPESFDLACKYDEALRAAKPAGEKRVGITGAVFVHRSLVPLRFAKFGRNENQQVFGFVNECEGMCGL